MSDEIIATPICPACSAELPAGVEKCPQCGHEQGAFASPRSAGGAIKQSGLSGLARFGIVVLGIAVSAGLVALLAIGDKRGDTAIPFALLLPGVCGVGSAVVFRGLGIGWAILIGFGVACSSFVCCFISCVSLVNLNFH